MRQLKEENERLRKIVENDGGGMVASIDPIMLE